jgi:hypothetical protein
MLCYFQVIQCEEDKDVLSKRVDELSGLNADLQNHLQGLRHELAVVSAELRLRGSHMPDSELRNDAASATRTHTSRMEDTHSGAHLPATSVAPSYDASGRVVSTAARRSIQATEAYVKDLHHQ